MKLKKVIIIMLIFILIFSSVIVAILLHNRENRTTSEETDRPKYSEIDSTIQRVLIRNNFYMIKSCVENFYTYYGKLYHPEDYIVEDSGESTEEHKKESINVVYSILDENYIDYRNITLENLESKLSETNPLSVTIKDMYVAQKDENMEAYFVYGNVRDIKTSEISDFSMMVKADMRNRTYKILLQDYIEEKYNNIQIGEKIKIDLPDKIEANKYNTIDFEAVSDSKYVTDIIRTYKDNMKFSPEEVYNNLDSEYKEKRFKNLELFKKYVSEKVEEIKTLRVEKYQKQKYDNYVQYVCIDNNGKYIIINEVAPMKYSLILDTYTVDLPEFRAKYESVNNENKVALNMEKIKEAINDNNYKYVYGKLNEIFRNNNFETCNDFVEDFAPKFFKENTFRYKNIEERNNNIYYITVLVKDKNDESQEKQNVKIVMKLLEDTNFEISYNIAE